MRVPPAAGFAAPRHPTPDLGRPIASGLKLPEQHVQLIDQSHLRCVALGVSRIGRPDLSTLARPELAVARERNRRLYDHAVPVMELLYEQIVRSESMVVLTDATGTVLHSIGDDDFLGRARQVALAPGANWSEQAKGTNAVGTALIEEKPVLVHADEHFLHANHFLTCSAAPILDPRGNILGVLDVSGDHRSYHPHTMALVKMSARMIENRWLSADADPYTMRLHFHSRAAYIGTWMEGILAVGAEGRIVGANRSALEQLGMGGAAVRQHTLSSLLGTTVATLVDHFRNPMATPIGLPLEGGRPLWVMARFNWPAWRSPAQAPVTRPPVAGTATAGPMAGTATAAPMAGTATAAPMAGTATAAPMAGTATAAPMAGTATAAPVAARPPQPTAPAQPTAHGQRLGLAGLRTGDTRLDEVTEKARRLLDRGIPILILGEAGSGKGWLARAIHDDSARSGRPFVVVNCAAAPAALIEAELFGCGSGPHAPRLGSEGRIVQADGGTLFLDAVGELPPAVQGRLLRVLQERQVRPVDSLDSVPVDVQIVCASSRDLRPMVAARSFREDLYHHLNGLTLRLPALRKRSDLPALVHRILEDQAGAGAAYQVAPDVMRILGRHPWPGNLRQLHNVLRTACALAAGGPHITREHLPEQVLEDSLRGPAADRAEAPAAAAGSAPRTLGDLEIEAMRQAVLDCGGNISEASKRLGISRNTIYRKLRWRQPNPGHAGPGGLVPGE